VTLYDHTDAIGGAGMGFAQDLTIAVPGDGTNGTTVADEHGYARSAGSTFASFSFGAQDFRFVRVVMSKLGTVTEGGTTDRAQLAEVSVS